MYQHLYLAAGEEIAKQRRHTGVTVYIVNCGEQESECPFLVLRDVDLGGCGKHHHLPPRVRLVGGAGGVLWKEETEDIRMRGKVFREGPANSYKEGWEEWTQR